MVRLRVLMLVPRDGWAGILPRTDWARVVTAMPSPRVSLLAILLGCNTRQICLQSGLGVTVRGEPL